MADSPLPGTAPTASERTPPGQGAPAQGVSASELPVSEKGCA